MTQNRSSRPRTPGFLQVGLTLAIAVLLAAVTLTTRQPPPPSIAEFAPQAAEQIKEAPKEQSSQFGSGGDGDCPPGAECAAGEGAGVGPGGGTTTTTAAAPTTTLPPRASVKRCVGDPPRQIEDPQSPPCVPFWDDSKGNGGATWPGVTKDTITIAVPNAPTELYDALVAFFNDRFQLYGRRIRWVSTNTNGTAAADKAKEAGAFASTASYADVPYYRRLAEHGIIGIYRTTDFTDSELAAFSPYVWGYTKSFTQMLADIGDWSCSRLVGAKAAHAGRIQGAALSDRERSFAIFMDLDTPDSTLTGGILKSALEQCGATVPFTTTYPRFDNDPVRIRNEITRIKSEGVTTVYCLCVSTNLVSLQVEAESQLYQPEWIITSYPQLVQGDGYTGPQMERVFGLSFGPMDRVPEDHPQIWAVREADPDNPNASLRTGVIGSNDIHYRTFLALMSGIQMAGPNLTPETFREGLHRTRFPNPEHPIMAGTVGFEGDYSMTDDAAEFWFSETSPGPYADNQAGPTFCWVNGGERHRRGTWTKGEDPFFKGPCDSGNRSVS